MSKYGNCKSIAKTTRFKIYRIIIVEISGATTGGRGDKRPVSTPEQGNK